MSTSSQYWDREFGKAIRASELDDAGSDLYMAAAYRLAVALGQCRMRGATPDGDGILPPALATAALRSLKAYLAEATDSLLDVTEAFEQDGLPMEFDDHVLTVLEFRHDLYALGVVVDEAFLAAIETNDQACQELGAERDAFYVKMNEIDTQLREQKPLLAGAIESGWYHETKDSLVGQWKDYPPWWLDGTLERAHTRNRKQSLRSPRFATEKLSQALVDTALQPNHPLRKVIEWVLQADKYSVAADSLNQKPTQAIRDGYYRSATGEQAVIQLDVPNREIVVVLYDRESRQYSKDDAPPHQQIEVLGALFPIVDGEVRIPVPSRGMTVREDFRDFRVRWPGQTEFWVAKEEPTEASAGDAHVANSNH